MSQFDDREKAFEAKFHLDGETDFKVMARRDRLLGHWVALQLGLDGEAAATYAQGIVDVALADANEQTMLTRLLADLAAARSPFGSAELQAQLARLGDLARQQVMTELAGGQQTIAP